MKKILVLSIILSILSQTAFSQSNEDRQKYPHLNGHAFPSLSNFRNSFICTSLKVDLGFGTTSLLEIPGIVIDGTEILPFEGKILFLSTQLEYQQRFTPWLSLYFSYQLGGRLGTDMSTILADGVNTINGGDIGWNIRLLKREKFNLSATIGVKNVVGSFINVAEYVEEIIEGNPDPRVIKVVPAMFVRAGLHGAYAFSPTFGFQFSGSYAFGESFARGKTGGFFSGGAIGDVDFYPAKRVPVGLALGYWLSSEPEVIMNNDGTSNMIMFKLGYTGSDDFELGAQFTYFNVRLKSVEGNPFISQVSLVLRYYF
jgi:hypothetical protein